MPAPHHTPTTGAAGASTSPSNDSSPAAASEEHGNDAIGAGNDTPGGRAIQGDMRIAQTEPKKKKKKNGKKGVSLMLENVLSRGRFADILSRKRGPPGSKSTSLMAPPRPGKLLQRQSSTIPPSLSPNVLRHAFRNSEPDENGIPSVSSSSITTSVWAVSQLVKRCFKVAWM